MTRAQIKEILDRVRDWPLERQADLAEVARLMEAQDRSNLRLGKDEAAEVERRLADVEAKSVSLAEFNEHLRRRYGV